MKNFVSKIFVFMVCVCAFGCKDSSTFWHGNTTYRTSCMYLNFWNTDTSKNSSSVYGNCPRLELDKVNSSKCINTDYSKTFKGQIGDDPSQVEIIIDNIRLADEYGYFEVRNVEVEEYSDEGFWEKMSVNTNPVVVEPLKGLDVVLVLDASGAMLKSSALLKQCATNFISRIVSKVPTAQFAVVAFSDDINATKLTDATQAESYINQMQFEGQPLLYSGLDTAITILANSDVSARVMVTLTSGKKSDADTKTIDDIVSRLNQDEDFQKIQSFAIAFNSETEIDKNIKERVEKFCLRGFAMYPEDDDDFAESFEYFSSSITVGCDLKYTRPATKYSENNKKKIRFKFVSDQQRL